MGIKFRKSFKIAPGVKINLNKKSTSITFGGKGLHHTISSTGKHTTSAGILGTGVYYTKTSKVKRSEPQHRDSASSFTGLPDDNNPKNTEKWYKKTGWIVFFLIIFSPVGLYLMWKYKENWGKRLKYSLSVFFSLWFVMIMVSAITDDDSSFNTGASTVIETETQTKIESEINTETELQTDTQTETQVEAQTEIQTEMQTEIQSEVPIVLQTEPQIESRTEMQTEYVEKVWVNSTGTKYHRRSNCSNMKNSYEVTKDEAIAMGKEACKKCY